MITIQAPRIPPTFATSPPDNRYTGWPDGPVFTSFLSPVDGLTARADLKWYLMNKYRSLLIDKLTAEDFEELWICQRKWSAAKTGQGYEFLHRFVVKLQEYVPDEILMREIAGIGSLVSLMKPEDFQVQLTAGRGEREEVP